MNYNKTRMKSAMLTATIVGAGTAITAASTLAINFKGGRYGAALLADVSATAFGVAAGDWTNTASTPNGSTTISGVSFTWTADNEWSKLNAFGGTPGDDEVFHGYLDDSGSGATVIITGLTAWLGSDTSYTVTLLSSGDGTAVKDDGELFVSSGGTSLGTFTMTQVTSQGSGSGSSSIDSLTSDTLFIQGSTRSGSTRGGIAGVIINSIPEPSSVGLLGLGGIALMLRRRR